MEKMLQFDPRKRIDVHGALKHPWLAQLHDEAAEPAAPGKPSALPLQHSLWEVKNRKRRLPGDIS